MSRTKLPHAKQQQWWKQQSEQWQDKTRKKETQKYWCKERRWWWGWWWCVTGDLIAGECQVPGAETTTLNYNEEPAHLAPPPLSSLQLQWWIRRWYKLQSEDRAICHQPQHWQQPQQGSNPLTNTSLNLSTLSSCTQNPQKLLLQMLAEKRGSRKWKESNVSRASLCLTVSYYKPTRLSFASLWVQSRVLQF